MPSPRIRSVLKAVQFTLCGIQMPLEDAEALVRVMELERETPVSFTLKVHFKQNRFLWELCCLLNLGVGTKEQMLLRDKMY